VLRKLMAGGPFFLSFLRHFGIHVSSFRRYLCSQGLLEARVGLVIS
jgi:hypothetical protein